MGDLCNGETWRFPSKKSVRLLRHKFTFFKGTRSRDKYFLKAKKIESVPSVYEPDVYKFLGFLVEEIRNLGFSCLSGNCH